MNYAGDTSVVIYLKGGTLDDPSRILFYKTVFLTFGVSSVSTVAQVFHLVHDLHMLLILRVTW